MPSTTLTSTAFRQAVGQFATGVTVITAERAPGRVHGMTANSFTSVSLDPLLILICVEERAHLLPLLKQHGRFGVNVLREDQQSLSEYFAGAERLREEEPEVGVRFRWTDDGIPLLEGALAQLTCRVVAMHPSGDHNVVIASVDSVEICEGRPLLFHCGRYKRLAP